jgi:hypothetical protein
MHTGDIYGWTELHPNDLKTIDSCKILVGNVFGEIAERHGEDEAARIFAPYSKRTKRQVKLDSDVMLLWKCDDMKPLNVRQLAFRLAKERRINQDAKERKIWRVLKDKNVRRQLEYIKAAI